MLTDLDDGYQLQLLQGNIDANSLAVSKRATVQPLLWGEPLTNEVKHFISTGLDYVIASDVIYSDEIVEPLVNTLQMLCKNPQTKILLAYETHKYTPIVEFFKKIKQTNLEVNHLLMTDLHPEFQLGGVSLKVLQLK